jgi:BirA family biotin operon repressor/biotin-[acetyl-CoA-carboxylase] ligase
VAALGNLAPAAAPEVTPVERYTREGIEDGLGTRVVGRYLRWHDTLPSTNDLAMRLAETHAPEGTVVVAEEQTAGRGRRGRVWVSPRGGIWCSVILRPRLPLAQIPLIGLASAVAAARAIRLTTRAAATVKWPNDVLSAGRKVAGVLTEAGPEAAWIVVGIGINANVRTSDLPRDALQPPGSLAGSARETVDRAELTRALLRELDRAYALVHGPAGPARVLRAWREMADTLGRAVRVEGQGRALAGIAEDVDDLGALLVRTPDGVLERVVAGEVTLRSVG